MPPELTPGRPGTESGQRSKPEKEATMANVHTSRIRIDKHEGPHRTARIEQFQEPVHFGVHGGIKHFYQDKYGRELPGPEYPATLDHIIAGVAG